MSNTTCLAQVLFKGGEQCSELRADSSAPRAAESEQKSKRMQGGFGAAHPVFPPPGRYGRT